MCVLSTLYGNVDKHSIFLIFVNIGHYVVLLAKPVDNIMQVHV